MCAALAEAHGLGIVHRDIKPQNILFGSVGTVRLPKLADFGIAKWSVDADVDREQRAEDTAIVAGQKLAMYSPSWAAPEQLAGQPVSPATDIYSLAIVAIYMLSGKAIFADEDVYAGYKKRRHGDDHVRDALEPLGIAKDVVAVLSRALAFDPKKRIARVDELSAGLESAIEPATAEIARVSLEPHVEPPPLRAGVHRARPCRAAGQCDSGDRSRRRRADSAGDPAAPRRSDAADVSRAAHGSVDDRRSSADRLGAPARARRLAATSERSPHALRDGPQRRRRSRRAPRHEGARLAPARARRTAHGSRQRADLLRVTCRRSRPSGAVAVQQSSDIALVTPRAQEIGHLRVVQGVPDGAQMVFTVGSERVAVGTEDCADPILFDFGPGSDAYFVYTQGRTVPKSGRRG